MKIQLNQSETNALSVDITILLDKKNLFDIFCVYNKNQERFTSEKYNKAKKTIDYVVEMKDKIVGKVKFYFDYREVSYLLLKQYKRGSTIHHIQEIIPTEVESVYLAEEIEKKIHLRTFSEQTLHYKSTKPFRK